ncbi:MAG TPA: YggT family protein [Thermoanaerobaculia bacterium]|nr:YggT family protein [Thermoanaerobaculia bacterium]
MNRTAVAIGPVIFVVLKVLDIIQWTVFIWVILSWLQFFASRTSFRWRYKAAYNFLLQLNDIFSRLAHPFLKPFRRMSRNWDTAGIDWSPLLLWLTILLLRAIIQGVYGLILAP